jgi:hypothetical protein
MLLWYGREHLYLYLYNWLTDYCRHGEAITVDRCPKFLIQLFVKASVIKGKGCPVTCHPDAEGM